MGNENRTTGPANRRLEAMRVLRRGAVHGLIAGAVGVAVMTAAEKTEQRLTSRPNSLVPGATSASMIGRGGAGMNLVMHFGQGVLLGALRGVMADSGLRGPWSSVMFAAVRLTNDQTLENATGVGAPPWTWPREELAIDLFHKLVYAFATGVVADRLAAGHGPGPGGEHARLRTGRHTDVGPPR